MNPTRHDEVMPDRELAWQVVRRPDYRFNWYYDKGLVGRGYRFVFRQRLVQLLRLLRKRGITPHRVLDVGCGPMVPSHTLLNRFNCQYFGFDLQDQEVFGDFKRLIALSTNHYEHVSPLRASGYSIPFRDGVFDTVLALDVLEHLDNAATVVKEMERVARRDAYFVISLPTENTLTKLGYLVHVFRGERARIGKLEYHYAGNVSDCRAMVDLLAGRWRLAALEYTPVGFSPAININAVLLFQRELPQSVGR